MVERDIWEMMNDVLKLREDMNDEGYREWLFRMGLGEYVIKAYEEGIIDFKGLKEAKLGLEGARARVHAYNLSKLGYPKYAIGIENVVRGGELREFEKRAIRDLNNQLKVKDLGAVLEGSTTERIYEIGILLLRNGRLTMAETCQKLLKRTDEETAADALGLAINYIKTVKKYENS